MFRTPVSQAYNSINCNFTKTSLNKSNKTPSGLRFDYSSPSTKNYSTLHIQLAAKPTSIQKVRNLSITLCQQQSSGLSGVLDAEITQTSPN